MRSPPFPLCTGAAEFEVQSAKQERFLDGSRRQGKGVAPGTFVHALLQNENRVIGGRKFTDEEVSPPCKSPGRPRAHKQTHT